MDPSRFSSFSSSSSSLSSATAPARPCRKHDTDLQAFLADILLVSIQRSAHCLDGPAGHRNPADKFPKGAVWLGLCLASAWPCRVGRMVS